jgi:hypothetical protein
VHERGIDAIPGGPVVDQARYVCRRIERADPDKPLCADVSESAESAATGDAVGAELMTALETPERGFGAWPKVAVDREKLTGLRKQELRYRDVPAGGAAPQCSVAETVPP